MRNLAIIISLAAGLSGTAVAMDKQDEWKAASVQCRAQNKTWLAKGKCLNAVEQRIFGISGPYAAAKFAKRLELMAKVDAHRITLAEAETEFNSFWVQLQLQASQQQAASDAAAISEFSSQMQGVTNAMRNVVPPAVPVLPCTLNCIRTTLGMSCN